MRFIEDIHNWRRFHSVQLNMIGGAFGAALTAYGSALAISPAIVAGIPHWVLTVLCVGSMAFAFGAAAARAIDQPNLPPSPPKPPGDNDFHQGTSP
jgi:hypothetical protein